jgi:hypothetical protein
MLGKNAHDSDSDYTFPGFLVRWHKNRIVVVSHKAASASIVTVTATGIFGKTACDSDSNYTFLGLLVRWHKILNSLYLLLFLTRKSVQVYSMLLTQAIIPTVTILAFLGTKLVFFLFIVSRYWVFHLSNWQNVQFNTDLFSDMQKYLYTIKWFY